MVSALLRGIVTWSLFGFGVVGAWAIPIAIWAAIGFGVAAAWAIFAAFVRATPVGSVWFLMNVTCPALFTSWHLHIAVPWYWILAANSATYAMVGLLVQAIRQLPRYLD